MTVLTLRKVILSYTPKATSNTVKISKMYFLIIFTKPQHSIWWKICVHCTNFPVYVTIKRCRIQIFNSPYPFLFSLSLHLSLFYFFRLSFSLYFPRLHFFRCTVSFLLSPFVPFDCFLSFVLLMLRSHIWQITLRMFYPLQCFLYETKATLTSSNKLRT